MSSTAVQFLQDGVLHSIDVPGQRNQRETERLQEYIQNTAFGTTNLLGGMSQDRIGYPQGYCCWSGKIVGGVFDDLTRGEAQFLREHGWTEDRQWYDPELTDDEMLFLCEKVLPARNYTFPSIETAEARPKADEKAQKAAQREPESKAKAEEQAKEEQKEAKAEGKKLEQKVLGAVGDGRPIYSCSPSTSSSSSAAHSVEDRPTPSTSTYSSPLARLVEASIPLPPDNENIGTRAAKPRPTPQTYTLWHMILQHEQAHGRSCLYNCVYSPTARAFLVPAWPPGSARTLPVLDLEGSIPPRPLPPASPALTVGRLVGLGLEKGEIPVVDWTTERRRWVYEPGGWREDPAWEDRRW